MLEEKDLQAIAQIVDQKLEYFENLEILEKRITALEAMVKKLNREMEKLKRAQ